MSYVLFVRRRKRGIPRRARECKETMQKTEMQYSLYLAFFNNSISLSFIYYLEGEKKRDWILSGRRRIEEARCGRNKETANPSLSLSLSLSLIL
jgi:hypothetical protein